MKEYFKPIHFIFLFLFVTNLGFTQLMWRKTYGGTAWERGHSVQQTTDYGYIVTGITSSLGNSFQAYLIKTDSLGDSLWARAYGGTGNEEGRCVKQTTDHGYIIAGYTTSFGNSYQIYLIKTDSLGDTLWTKNYGGPNWEFGYSVQQTFDNGYIVVGGGEFMENDDPVILIKTDSLGDTLWTKSYNIGEGRSVLQTQDGGFIIAGYGGGDILLMKTDSLGDTLWTKFYNGPYQVYYGYSVSQTQDGGYIISGWTWESEYSKYYLAKTDSLGDTLWTRTYGEDGHHAYAYSCQQTIDSGYIITGFSDAFALGVVYLIKTDSLGDTLWTQIYGGTTFYSRGHSVMQTQDGGYIIAGETSFDSLGNNVQVYLIKTDEQGNSNIKEEKIMSFTNEGYCKTIFSGRLQLPKDKSCKVFDITGRVVMPDRIKPGIYFIEVDGKITQKVVKVK